MQYMKSRNQDGSMPYEETMKIGADEEKYFHTNPLYNPLYFI
jgi:hypothetical protein